ncbi:MAG: hypothetical protein COB35_00175 [Gammaproteobacteria bacterium]|nr:MAG: hypothetical protein COB35_00175 [Gammaproteobacteria bacterium]
MQANAKNKPMYKTITLCGMQKTMVKKSQCLDIVVENIDRELQTWVNNQTFALEELAIKTGRGSALSLFKRSQSAFIKYREDNCRWQYLAVSAGHTATIVYKKCYIMLAKNRIKELSHIEKE